MEAILYEIQRLQMAGFVPTRILVTQDTLEAMREAHLAWTGINVYYGLGTFNGLPVLPVRDLTANFEIAIAPTRRGASNG